MTEADPLILYSRQDCHLCEVAAALLARLDLKWQEVDIDQDSSLQSRYGLSVPVLRHAASGRELCYPFGEQQVMSFIAMESG